MKQTVLLIFLLLGSKVVYAQLYKGVMKGDTPIQFEIRATNKGSEAYLKIIGLDKGWRGLDVKRIERGNLLLTRPKGDVNITLTDISEEYNKNAGSIYFGTGEIGKGNDKYYITPILVIRQDVKD
jgi:hypothetical protein